METYEFHFWLLIIFSLKLSVYSGRMITVEEWTSQWCSDPRRGFPFCSGAATKSPVGTAVNNTGKHTHKPGQTCELFCSLLGRTLTLFCKTGPLHVASWHCRHSWYIFYNCNCALYDYYDYFVPFSLSRSLFLSLSNKICTKKGRLLCHKKVTTTATAVVNSLLNHATILRVTVVRIIT